MLEGRITGKPMRLKAKKSLEAGIDWGLWFVADIMDLDCLEISMRNYLAEIANRKNRLHITRLFLLIGFPYNDITSSDLLPTFSIALSSPIYEYKNYPLRV